MKATATPFHLLAFFPAVGHPYTRSAVARRYRIGTLRVVAYDCGDVASDVQAGKATAFRIDRRSDGKGAYKDFLYPLRPVIVQNRCFLTPSSNQPIEAVST